MKYAALFLVTLWGSLVAASAEVRLPAIFSDHMVLQAGVAVPIWGWAEPDEEIMVNFAGQTKTAKADAKGKWSLRLDPIPASSESRVMTIRSSNPQSKIRHPQFNDVLVGEVWLGSGQSNMARDVSNAQDFAKEKAAAKLPQIRMFTVTSNAAANPQEDCTGSWVVCAPDTVGKFSGTLYFFGREVHRSLKVPMGLINSSVGGTPIELWIDAEAQRKEPALKGFFESKLPIFDATEIAAGEAKYAREKSKWKKAAAEAKVSGKNAPHPPVDPQIIRDQKGEAGGLFNGKIAPLIPYAIRGAIWYQGENNATDSKAPYYHAQLSLLIQDWRTRWGEGDFPFAWVQLPNYTRPGEGWVLVREGMLQTLSLRNTGMAITTDIGDVKAIHPTNKQEVGRRLSLWALGTVYGQKVTATSGPLPAGHEIMGGEIKLRFTHADGGLIAKNGDLKGFVIAGEDKRWKPAAARIEDDQVIVSHAEIRKPLAARYSWQDNPDGNLINGAGLPASPFRTDNWK